MTIERVIVKNYRVLREADIFLRPTLNIIVGDNESGKSTLLEAINLALRCQINKKHAMQELHPFLLNVDATQEFIHSHKSGNPMAPPRALIELYIVDKPEFAELKGTNNINGANVPGVSLSISLNESFYEEFREYVSDPNEINDIPIEYYHVVWQSFAGHPISTRAIPIRSTMIDSSSISSTYAANKYVLDIVRDYLTNKQRVNLSLSYRSMKDLFLENKNIEKINQALVEKSGEITDRLISVSLDTTTRSSWETGVIPHLNNIPLTLVGKGEQSAIKIKLAIESEANTDILLIEEPENHLSHANLNKLISHIETRSDSKQLIVTTHSSFVLNKLGVDRILMFDGKIGITLGDLPAETKRYFMRLPGHDTLRMVLSTRCILVEGPSDELVVQRAYRQTHGRMPLEDGVEVIAVGSLAFKRFLDIAKLLQIDTRVVTDNDGDVGAVERKYANFVGLKNIDVCFDRDESRNTLELQIVKCNGRAVLNDILNKDFSNDDELADYMIKNKTNVALSIFESQRDFVIPEYIKDAVK